MKGKGFRVFQCKIYYDNKNLVVDTCYRKEEKQEFFVSLHDGTDIRSLIQTVERNEERGLYLTDGNARLFRGDIVFSAVFSTVKYGSCDYKVVYNVDAPQLYERGVHLAKQGYHVTSIIPTTGNLTPQFIVIFWC